jgi:hypothetical protein
VATLTPSDMAIQRPMRPGFALSPALCTSLPLANTFARSRAYSLRHSRIFKLLHVRIAGVHVALQ